jgi:hypothetical protein
MSTFKNLQLTDVECAPQMYYYLWTRHQIRSYWAKDINAETKSKFVFVVGYHNTQDDIEYIDQTQEDAQEDIEQTVVVYDPTVVQGYPFRVTDVTFLHNAPASDVTQINSIVISSLHKPSFINSKNYINNERNLQLHCGSLFISYRTSLVGDAKLAVALDSVEANRGKPSIKSFNFSFNSDRGMYEAAKRTFQMTTLYNSRVHLTEKRLGLSNLCGMRCGLKEKDKYEDNYVVIYQLNKTEVQIFNIAKASKVEKTDFRSQNNTKTTNQDSYLQISKINDLSFTQRSCGSSFEDKDSGDGHIPFERLESEGLATPKTKNLGSTLSDVGTPSANPNSLDFPTDFFVPETQERHHDVSQDSIDDGVSDSLASLISDSEFQQTSRNTNTTITTTTNLQSALLQQLQLQQQKFTKTIEDMKQAHTKEIKQLQEKLIRTNDKCMKHYTVFSKMCTEVEKKMKFFRSEQQRAMVQLLSTEDEHDALPRKRRRSRRR